MENNKLDLQAVKEAVIRITDNNSDYQVFLSLTGEYVRFMRGWEYVLSDVNCRDLYETYIYFYWYHIICINISCKT